MNEHEYTREVLRTCAEPDRLGRLVLGAMGLAGEAGEVVDAIKKVRFQGHILDVDMLTNELGDVLWYLALLCDTLGITFEDARRCNVAKMHRRYPNGFEVALSVNREESFAHEQK